MNKSGKTHKKILFIVDQLFEHGGIERILCVRANALSKLEGYKVVIATTDQQAKTLRYHLDPAVDLVDMNVEYNRTRSYFHPLNLLKLRSHIAKFKQVLRRTGPDVVVICNHGMETFFAPAVCAVPVIKEFHFSQATRAGRSGFLKGISERLLRRIYPKYDRLVVLNPDEARYFPESKVCIIPNPLPFGSPKRARLSNCNAIAAGRIAPVKGFEEMIEIWRLVVDKLPEARLKIYGQGESTYVQGLKDRVRELGLGAHLLFVGPTENMQEAMEEASIYLMTSLNECFPLVLLEALSIGLPVITYDIPTGPRHIITNQSGFLISNKDRQAFAMAVLKLFQNTDLRESMGKAALVHSKTFSIEAVLAKWTDLFNDITSSN